MNLENKNEEIIQPLNEEELEKASGGFGFESYVCPACGIQYLVLPENAKCIVCGKTLSQLQAGRGLKPTIELSQLEETTYGSE